MALELVGWWRTSKESLLEDVCFGGMRNNVGRRVFLDGFVFPSKLFSRLAECTCIRGGMGVNTRLLAARVAISQSL